LVRLFSKQKIRRLLMSTIGIIANPASGKDIRRIAAHATVFTKNEKMNIIERIILGAQALGVNRVIIMPDLYRLGITVRDRLKASGELKCEVLLADIDIENDHTDTIRAAEYMEEHNVECIVTLGGDGTNRAVAKSVKNVPLITISTGTNNVYPTMIEGTVAGMAAAVIASKQFNEELLPARDKRIEIYKEGQLLDIALVDAAITDHGFIGTKAIWSHESIGQIFVTRSHPASIGFSAIVGVRKIVSPEDDFGAYIILNEEGTTSTIAPISAGALEAISIDEPVLLPLGEEYQYRANSRGTVALDGEKEIIFNEGDILTFKITRDGPYHVDIIKTLETAQRAGFFTRQI
jgi:predicted polyphosphate/ATP-dependent NAD kinase